MPVGLFHPGIPVSPAHTARRHVVRRKKMGLRPGPRGQTSQMGNLFFHFVTGINDESSFESTLMKLAPGCGVCGYDYSANSWGPEITNDSELRDRAHFRPFVVRPARALCLNPSISRIVIIHLPRFPSPSCFAYLGICFYSFYEPSFCPSLLA
ncbi:hypothetical protein EI94DRAFT_1739097 [Lactarius quietus]|nr:hypothetical protein EI94DRAFT_1739097 [Lactarius quietus]